MRTGSSFATFVFLSRAARSVLSFAYPGKFYESIGVYWPRHIVSMTSDELLNCDDELTASVRALKANMHAVPIPSLAELAHDCVVANDLAAALEGLELAPL
jgi:hypothetical protein